MNLPLWALRRPVTVSVFVLACLVVSLLSSTRLSMELLPRLSLPYATVLTLYPGADPQTVEQTLTRQVEAIVGTVGGVRSVQSLSVENASVVAVEFRWGTALEGAIEDIRARLSAARLTLPEGAQDPVVLAVDPSLLPLMYIAVKAPAMTQLELTDLALDVIRPRLEQVPGVGQAAVLGGSERVIQVLYDSDRLRENGITPSQLQQMIRYQNVVVPSGPLIADGTRYATRVGRPLASLEELADLVIGQPSQPQATYGLGSLVPQVLRVGDVATVEQAERPRSGIVRVNGEPALVVRVIGRSGANAVDVSREVRRALAELEARFPGLQTDVLYDQATFITRSLANLARDGAIGAAIAAGVLLVFVHSVRAVLVIAASIPLSIALTLAALHAGGLSLNLMTLGGLALSTGMLVDNAIVVLENIYRHRQQGKSALEAAATGTQEVLAAVTGATVTTLVVFAPVIFIGSLAGSLFREVGITVAIALGASLLVSVLVVPPLARSLLEGQGAHAVPSGQYEEWSQRGAGGLYRRLLAAALGRRGSVVLAAVAAFALTLPLWGRLGLEFLPESRDAIISLQAVAAPGTPLEETARRVELLEQQLRSFPETRDILVQMGHAGANDLLAVLGGSRDDAALVTVTVSPGPGQRTASQIVRDILASSGAATGLEIRPVPDRNLGTVGDVFANELVLRLSGPDIGQLRQLAETVKARIESSPGAPRAYISPGANQPELIFDVRRSRALVGGLTTGQVGLALRQALVGEQVSSLPLGNRQVPVVVAPAPEEVRDLDAALDFRITSPVAVPGLPSHPVRLDAIAEPVITQGPPAILRLNGERTVEIRLPLQDIGLATAKAHLEKAVSEIELPPGYRMTLAGLHRLVEEAFGDLGLALVLSLLAVYLVLAAQFESWLYPVVIMSSVPLAGIGSAVALYLADQRLGVIALIGLIMLGGLVVNNGIVLLDYIERLRRQGLSLHEAVVAGSATRLRPILMTAVTTVLGLLPLAFSPSEGSNLQRPLAVALIGGLVSGTLLTLFVVPCFYVILASWRERRDPGIRAGSVPSPRRLDSLALLFVAVGFGWVLFSHPALGAASTKGDIDLVANLDLEIHDPGASPVYALGSKWETAIRDARLQLQLINGLDPQKESVETLRMELHADWFRPISLVGYRRVVGDFFLGRLGQDETRAVTLRSRNVLGNVETRLEASYTQGGLSALSWFRRFPSGLFDDLGDGMYQLRGELRQGQGNGLVWVRNATWSQPVTEDGEPADGSFFLLTTGSELRGERVHLTGHVGILLDDGRVSPVIQAGIRLPYRSGAYLDIGLASATSGSTQPIIDLRYHAEGRHTSFTSLLRASYSPDGRIRPSVYLGVEPRGKQAEWQLMLEDTSRFRLGLITTF